MFSYIRDRLPWGDKLPVSQPRLEELMRLSGAEPWHAHAISHRQSRRHACVACRWLAEALPTGAHVFEPGCGSGANLLWLGLKGVGRLSGADISAEAVSMGRQLAQDMHMQLDIWQDDCLKPARLPDPVDGIVSVNWLYHIPGASLDSFLQTYAPALKPGGYLALDMVTRHYDRQPGNQWHTMDRALPEAQRRPSEYTIRLDRQEVEAIARGQGFRLERDTCFVLSRPQRAVFLLRRV
ncbi:MAG: class I SAM-dependent methyltransferase [Desulfovibrio sp.]|nr:class I SAM-dependent methyltransferase [Desulfovibrio sp.]